MFQYDFMLPLCTVKHRIFAASSISRFWNVEILLHFYVAFSQCSTGIYLAFDGQTEFLPVSNFAIDGQTEFLPVSNFAIFSYSQNSRKFDVREKYVLQYCLSHWDICCYLADTVLFTC